MPPAAKNITGTVVSRRSSRTRGLVSPTYAATTSCRLAGPGPRSTSDPDAAGARWPTYVTELLGYGKAAKHKASTGRFQRRHARRSLSPRVGRLGGGAGAGSRAPDRAVTEGPTNAV